MHKNFSQSPNDVFCQSAGNAEIIAGFPPSTERSSAERRKAHRYQVRKRLLSVCDFHAGQILDISTTGLSFEIVHFRETLGKIVPATKPRQSDKLDILSPSFDGYLMRNVPVLEVFDIQLGRKYLDNQDILVYRRGVHLAEPLTESQMAKFVRYFAEEQLPARRHA